MFVIRRRVGEEIKVTCNCGCGKDVLIVVKKIIGDKKAIGIKIGFEDPERNFEIKRKETENG